MNDVEERRPGEASRRTGILKARAHELGFSAVGITRLDANPHAAEFEAWLKAGYAGTMTYLNRQAKKRKDPRLVMPEARFAIVTLTNYFHGEAGPGPRIAQYAWSTDYHAVLLPRLERLAETLRVGSPGARARCYADTGPLPERELAQQAGLGWVAKNMMLINPQLGSFTFIGVVLTDAELIPDAPFTTDHCGSCRRCLDACPTDAFVGAGELDARRCISYVTIEYRGALSSAQAQPGEWLFGCDVCQNVCPWNERFAAPTTDRELAPRAELEQPDLTLLATDDENVFAHRFGDTPLARAGAARMRRNIAAATA